MDSLVGKVLSLIANFSATFDKIKNHEHLLFHRRKKPY
jgi:hypothetical protein